MSIAKPLVPLWAQLAVGAFVVSFVAILSLRSIFSVSEWHTPDSNFYAHTEDALMHSQISIFKGDIPTLVFFWEMGCKECAESLAVLSKTAPDINVIGVHLKTDPTTKTEARTWWLRNGQKTSPLHFDENQMLEHTFSVRQVPASYLYFPKQKTIRIHLGSLESASPSIGEIRTQLE